MRQITEIDDPRLVKALAHPLRVQLLRLLQDRVASPSELAAELGARISNVSYHIRALERLGVLELVETKPRRGAVEHYFRARGKLRISDEAWEQVPGIVKTAMVAATLEQITRYVHTAAAVDGFDNAHAHLSRRPMVLDQDGFAELARALREFLEQVAKIETESADRLAAGDHRDQEISSGLVMMLFEAPPATVGIPTDAATQKGERRADDRPARRHR